jgi:hypothetical protein
LKKDTQAFQLFFSQRTLMAIILIGLIISLIYTFIVPPWEHYDEPAHFEYAWLIAHRLKLPGIGDHDQDLRLAVGQSLVETRFFERRGLGSPNLTDSSEPLWMGVGQAGDPPLYYILTAIPLFLLQAAPVNWQLYSGRVFTILFLLITIYSAYKITSELTPPRHPLRWLAPLIIVLLPGFVEFMTAVNNYPAVIGFTSLWLLSAVRLIKNKWSIKQFLILLVLTIICLFTQKVVFYTIFLIPFILFLSLLPRGKEWMGWAIGIIVGIGILAISFNLNDAAFWLRSNEQEPQSREFLSQESGFKFALHGYTYPDPIWDANDTAMRSGFFQLIPIEISNQLKGKQVTIGAWVWAEHAIQGFGPGINALYQYQDQWYGFKPASISTRPQFIASTITVPLEEDRIQIWLRASSPEEVNTRIYFSGVVFTEGTFPFEISPQLNEKGTEGNWAGRPFKNLAGMAYLLRPGLILSQKLLIYSLKRLTA